MVKTPISDRFLHILQLPKLETLDVDRQPIEIPPPEVVKEGVEAIKNYWRQQQEVGVDYLCEAKLIIVGEAGAGKTTLAKKIKNPEYKLKPQEPSTEGIDVLRWSFPSAVRVKRDDRRNFTLLTSRLISGISAARRFTCHSPVFSHPPLALCACCG